MKQTTEVQLETYCIQISAQDLICYSQSLKEKQKSNLRRRENVKRIFKYLKRTEN